MKHRDSNHMRAATAQRPRFRYLVASMLLCAASTLPGCFRAADVRPLDPDEQAAFIEAFEHQGTDGNPASASELGFVLFMTGDPDRGLELMESAVRGGARSLPSTLIVLRQAFASNGTKDGSDLEWSESLLADLTARERALSEAADKAEALERAASEEERKEAANDPSILRARAMRNAEQVLVHSARRVAERRILTEKAKQLAASFASPVATTQEANGGRESGGADRNSAVTGDGSLVQYGAPESPSAVAVLSFRADGEEVDLAFACAELLLDALNEKGWETGASLLAQHVEVEIDRAQGEKVRLAALEPSHRTKGIQQRLGLLDSTPNGPKYYAGSADGRMNAQTAHAVRAFQRDQGLTADGVVGPVTRAALDRAIGARYELARPEAKLLRAVQAGRAARCRYVLKGEIGAEGADEIRVAVDFVDGADNAILAHRELTGAVSEMRGLVAALAEALDLYRPGRQRIVLPADSPDVADPQRATGQASADSVAVDRDQRAREAVQHLGNGASLAMAQQWVAAESAFRDAALADSTLEIAHRWQRDLALFGPRYDRYLDAAFEARVAAFRDNH